jgi:hypothetical protein
MRSEIPLAKDYCADGEWVLMIPGSDGIAAQSRILIARGIGPGHTNGVI